MQKINTMNIKDIKLKHDPKEAILTGQKWDLKEKKSAKKEKAGNIFNPFKPFL